VNFLLGTYATNLVEAQSAAAEQNQMLYVNGGGAASAKSTSAVQVGVRPPRAGRAPGRLDDEVDRRAARRAASSPSRRRSRCSGRTPSHGKDFRKGVSEFARRAAAGTRCRRRVGSS